jgi:hypothetical protein
MPFRHGKNTKVLFGAIDLSSMFNEASTSRTIETGETTTYGKSAKTYIVGLGDGTVSLSGMFDGDADKSDEELQAAVGLDAGKVVTIGVEGLTRGNRTMFLQAESTSYEVTSPVGDVVSVSAELQADDGIHPGVSLHDLTAETTTGVVTSVDNGASTANGGRAVLHITANTNASNTTIKVQHSSDNSTFADLGTFAVVTTGSTTAEIITVAAGTTVNRYLRASHTLAGAGSVTYHVSFSRS